jgi:hypothetical protein
MVPATPLIPQQNPSSWCKTEFPSGTGCSAWRTRPGPRRCRDPAISIRSVTSARTVRTLRSA